MLSIKKSAGIPFMIALAALLCWPCAHDVLGDTIKLTNGYTIHGKVVVDHPHVNTHVKVSFSNRGWMLIEKQDVEEITPDNTDQFEQAERRNPGEGSPEE